MIERFAKEEGISLAKAKERVVAFYDLEFVAALEQFLRRTKKSAKKGRQKTKGVCPLQKLWIFVAYKNFYFL